jgi:hypothetical protein
MWQIVAGQLTLPMPGKAGREYNKQEVWFFAKRG